MGNSPREGVLVVAIDTAPLARLFQAKDYPACAGLARDLAKAPDAQPLEQATCYTFLCRSLFQLREFGACIEAGLVAAHLAEPLQKFDLLGHALINVSAAQFHRGQIGDAVASLRRCLPFLHRFGEDGCNLEGYVLVNLGDYLRGLGDYTESIKYLEQARIWWLRVDTSQADRARSIVVEVHLDRGDTKGAGRLLPLGDEYVQQHPTDERAVLRHLCDKARYAMLTDEAGEAAALALDCIARSAEHLWALYHGLLVLAEVAVQRRNPEAAVIFGTLARAAADMAERPDLMAEADGLLMRLRMLQTEAVSRAMRSPFGRPKA